MPRYFISILMFVVSLSGCSSKQFIVTSCDFVTGAAESQRKRIVNDARAGRKHESDNIDLINGLLSVLAESINRDELASQRRSPCGT